jgi:hypothetical protein
MAHKPKFLDLMRNEIRLNHFSIRIEQAYVESVTGFVLLREAPSVVYECAKDPYLSVISGGGAEGSSSYPLLGVKRARLPVRGLSRPGYRLAGSCGMGEKPQMPAPDLAHRMRARSGFFPA